MNSSSKIAPPPLKVAVIGSGVAGLAAARALKIDGHQVVVYEKSAQLGGMWVYDPRVESDPLGQDPNREVVHGSLYPSLRANGSWQIMGFLDYPFRIRGDENPGRIFPGHKDVLKFLVQFAEDFGLVELIRFGCEVTRVEQVGSGNDEWVVEWTSNGRSSEEVFDAVVVCNGRYTKPRIALFPGTEKWPGHQLHSHNYRGPKPFENKVVVVIGIGASGMDISVEISDVATEVHLSTRMQSNNSIFNLDIKDNIFWHSEISYCHDDGKVSFSDGSSVVADFIVHCTGYDYHYPFLKTNGIVTIDDNRVGPLYEHIFPPKLAPGLSFIGIPFMVFVMPLIELQTRWVSYVLSGKGSLPSEEEMLAKVEKHYANMEANRIPKRHTHLIGYEASFEYMDSLATLAGLSKVDEQFKSYTRSYGNFIRENGYLRARDWVPDSNS